MMKFSLENAENIHMKVLSIIILGFLFAACNSTFNTNVHPTNNNVSNPPGGGSTPTSSRLFSFEYATLEQIDPVTAQRTIIYNGSADISEILNPGTRKGVTKHYFVDNTSKILVFDSTNVTMTEVASSFNGTKIASGNSLIVSDTNTNQHFVFVNGVATPVDSFYGLDGSTNTTIGSNCYGIGKSYFLCNNSGTNPHKILILKTDTNGNRSFKTFSGSFTNLNYPLANDKSVIVYVNDSSSTKHYHFSYTLETLVDLNLDSNSTNEIRKTNNKYFIYSRTIADDRISFRTIDDETGVTTILVDSTTPAGAPGSLLGHYWSITQFVNSDKTKFYYTGAPINGSTLSLLEVSQGQSIVYNSTLPDNTPVLLHQNKLYTLDSGEIKSFALSAGNMTLTSDPAFDAQLKSAICLKYNYPQSCQISLDWFNFNVTDSYAASNSNYFTSMGVTIEGDYNYIHLKNDNNGETKVYNSTDAFFNIYYFIQNSIDEEAAIIINNNAAS